MYSCLWLPHLLTVAKATLGQDTGCKKLLPLRLSYASLPAFVSLYVTFWKVIPVPGQSPEINDMGKGFTLSVHIGLHIRNSCFRMIYNHSKLCGSKQYQLKHMQRVLIVFCCTTQCFCLAVHDYRLHHCDVRYSVMSWWKWERSTNVQLKNTIYFFIFYKGISEHQQLGILLLIQMRPDMNSPI